MRIYEIQRMPAVGFSDLEDYLKKSGTAQKKKLPGGSGYTYSVFGNGVGVQIYDKNNPRGADIPIAKLLTRELGPKFPIKGALEVRLIGVDENYRGQGLAKSLYGIVLSLLKRPLVAGDTQTPGGRKNWVSISQVPGVEVYGYVSVPDEYLEDKKNIDKLMGDLGAQYIGKAVPWAQSRTNLFYNHFFAFPVEVNTQQSELRSLVKTKFSNVYHKFSSDIETGLYATYNR